MDDTVVNLQGLGVWPYDSTRTPIRCNCKLCGSEYYIPPVDMTTTNNTTIINHPLWSGYKNPNENFCPICLSSLQAVVKREQEIRNLL